MDDQTIPIVPRLPLLEIREGNCWSVLNGVCVSLDDLANAGRVPCSDEGVRVRAARKQKIQAAEMMGLMRKWRLVGDVGVKK